MMSIRTVLALLVPTSILGFSFWWWKRKTKNEILNVEKQNSLLEHDAECTMLSESLQKSPSKREYPDDVDDSEIYIEERIESIPVEKPIISSSPIKRKAEDGDDDNLSDSFIEYATESVVSYVSQDEEPVKVCVEEKIINLDENLLESENTNLFGEFDQCSEEVTLCDIQKSDVKVSSTVKEGVPLKRLRHQSSCDGDSAFVEDYSSDNISISGSDSLKSPECSTIGECPNSSLEDAVSEEVSCKEIATEEKFRDWYGPALESVIREDINWGSTPMSDSEGDVSDALLNKTMTIGGVSLAKLSISIESEVSEQKKNIGKKSTPKKSPTSPNFRSRKDSKRKTVKDSPSKKQTPTKSSFSKSESSKSKKDSPRKQTPKAKKVDTSEKGIDGPWRDVDTGEVDNTQKSFDYEFPEELSGKLIGRSGKHVKELKQKTGATICVEPEVRGDKRVVSITGLQSQIKKAESLLRARFATPLKKIADKDISTTTQSIIYTRLLEEEKNDVIVTAIVDVGHFFVQIFSPEVDTKIVQLQTELAKCYTSPRLKYMYSDQDLPKVNDYCASFIDNTWCRLKIIELVPENLAVVTYLDYGGNATVPTTILLKIRPDFLDVPVLAVECHLANVAPHGNDVEYTYAATNVFGQLVEGRVLQAACKTNENSSVERVELYYYDEENQREVCVNKELESWGLVGWSEV